MGAALPTRQLFVAFLLLTAFAIFGWTCRRLALVMFKGRGVVGGFREPLARAADVLMYFFLQRSVAREGLSRHHLIIFWGFLVITAGSLEIFVNGALGPRVSFNALFGAGFDGAFKFALDITNAMVLAAIIYAYFRRIVIKPRLIPFSGDAALILSLIALLCISHFISHGFHHAANQGVDPRLWTPAPGPPGPIGHMPVSRLFAGWGLAFSPATAHLIAETNYWLHLGILLLFLNYIPYSKHIHLLGALPNIALRARKQQGILPKLDLEDERQWGVGRYEQFDWKSLLDTYACTECARCSNECPANRTEKPLSPMHLIHDIRDEMLQRGSHLLRFGPADGSPEAMAEQGQLSAAQQDVLGTLNAMPTMVGGRISDETLWACTTCGACETACPVFIEHPLKIIQMRTHLVLAEGRMPAELARMFRGMESNQNPWGMGADKRGEWLADRQTPQVDDKLGAEYLVWVGCAGAYDDRAKQITRSWLNLLDRAGVSYEVLGSQEACTGDPARRAGNEFLFQTLAETNVETLNDIGAKKILTACPHCFHSLKNEYGQFGGNYEVWHHTQFLQRLLREGKLKPDGKWNKRTTFHDPCYLGRWNDEYESPRELIDAAGAQRVEMKRSRKKSFCCGAGGGHMWMEETEPRINNNRSEEAISTAAEVVATGCPFCNVMLTDGTKHHGKEETVKVMDVAEILDQATQGRATA